MISTEFVKGYRRDIPVVRPEADIDNGIDPDVAHGIHTARRWNRFLGIVVYDYLADRQVDTARIEEKIGQYSAWLDSAEYYDLAKAVALDEEKLIPLAQELHFHNLTAAMGNMWYPITRGSWEAAPLSRNVARQQSQSFLSGEGAGLYMIRNSSVYGDSVYAYFSGTSRLYRNSFESRLSEYDTGVVLLEFMKEKKWVTVIPSPKQFEQTSNLNEATNFKKPQSDFLVIEHEPLMPKLVIGAQVKNRVLPRHVDEYDPQRVVLIDAVADFDDTRMAKIEEGERNLHKIVWCGQICLERMGGIKTSGKHSFDRYADVDKQALLREQMKIRAGMGKKSNRLKRAVGHVSVRILRGLEGTPAQLYTPPQSYTPADLARQLQKRGSAQTV